MPFRQDMAQRPCPISDARASANKTVGNCIRLLVMALGRFALGQSRDKDHCGVAVAVAVALCTLNQSFDLSFGEMLAGSQLAVGKPPRRNCSFYGGWRDQLKVGFGHVFRCLPY